MDSKTKNIVAYITIIGWLVVYFTRTPEKDETESFHLRQALGANLLWFIPFIGWALGLVFMIIGAMNANNEEKKLLPILGEHFDNWFKSI